MKEKKILAKFSLNKETETELQEESINEAGETVITKKKVKKIVPNTFVIFKPSRSLREDVEVYQACEYGKALQGGAMSAILLEKRYSQDKGIFTSQELEERQSLYEKLLEKNKLITEIKNSETPDKAKLDSLEKESTDIIIAIQKIESKSQGLFNNSAERIARDRAIIYYSLFLAGKIEDGKTEDFITGKSFEEKRAFLDRLEEDGSEYDIKVLSIFLTAITVWMVSGKLEQQDVDNIIKDIDMVA
ncbi:MAG: hypothetical protein EKK57_07520 [Proteobacteria bacterium]|nr:MAG: hypothetical protein EKK57_07520 [Pseudomonadota bacterium]